MNYMKYDGNEYYLIDEHNMLTRIFLPDSLILDLIIDLNYNGVGLICFNYFIDLKRNKTTIFKC